eukprot:5782770-Alexandrium_andersonii.AAC.1
MCSTSRAAPVMAVRSSAKSARVAVAASLTTRRAGARRSESMPSMARGPPCGVEPGEVTGQGCTSPATSR